jgi:hypothetical protein
VPRSCEHVFVTSQGTAHGRFSRAIARRRLLEAELAAEELGGLALEDALALTYLYAEVGSPKFERAALRWLERYLAESAPGLLDVAHVAGLLAEAPRASGHARTGS